MPNCLTIKLLMKHYLINTIIIVGWVKQVTSPFYYSSKKKGKPLYKLNLLRQSFNYIITENSLYNRLLGKCIKYFGINLLFDVTSKVMNGNLLPHQCHPTHNQISQLTQPIKKNQAMSYPLTTWWGHVSSILFEIKTVLNCSNRPIVVINNIC